MSHSTFRDRRTNSLLDRVRIDIANLREDIGSLFLHTTKNTVPNGARELADQAKSQLAAGGAYAASRLRQFRGQPARETAPWVGGVVVVGLLAIGAYALIRASSPCNQGNCDEDDYQDDIEDA